MEHVTDNQLKAFFACVTETLEHLGIPYMVVGGFAAIFYGEPRLTIDVDIVVDMRPQHVVPFVACFPIPEYYVNEEAIRDSLRRKYPFNVIQSTTGAKVDLVPLPEDIFTRLAFQRRRRLSFAVDGRSADFISDDDIIVAKLIAYRQTGSEKHLRDAQGVVTMQFNDLNLAAIRRAADASGMLETFEQLLASTARRDTEE